MQKVTIVHSLHTAAETIASLRCFLFPTFSLCCQLSPKFRVPKDNNTDTDTAADSESSSPHDDTWEALLTFIKLQLNIYQAYMVH
jgi:hypothetical protein